VQEFEKEDAEVDVFFGDKFKLSQRVKESMNEAIQDTNVLIFTTSSMNLGPSSL